MTLADQLHMIDAGYGVVLTKAFRLLENTGERDKVQGLRDELDQSAIKFSSLIHYLRTKVPPLELPDPLE